MVNRIAYLLIVVNFIFSGCSRDENKPLVFKPVDLDVFSKNHRGFNLLGKYDVGWSNDGFSEEDFIIIRDLGFNFARLPLDYRTYTRAGNWDIFIEDEVEEIDQAVRWGKEYGVHVCIDLHRAPGYCINPATLPANQDLDLWTSPVAQKAYLNHWRFFAERYSDIPYEELSFNLLNEPGDIDENIYAGLMRKAVTMIQNINPDRIIFVDGLKCGRELVLTMKNDKNIIQSVHAYDPFTLTHYKAGWVEGSDTWPLPVWPLTDISHYLFGPWQPDYQSSLVLEGDFASGTEISINVQQVSNRSLMRISLDDQEVYSKLFLCGPDPGEDFTKIINTQWGYQNISGKDYKTVLPSDGQRLIFRNTEGDWMTFNRITLKSEDEEIVIIPGNTKWGSLQDSYTITSEGTVTGSDGKPSLGLGGLTGTLEMAKREKIPVMIQEFGVFNQTPHDVTIDYLNDLVKVFRDYDIGYVMWNMTGSMGIINSGRTDCVYEQYRGEQLDRAMTTILQGNGK